MQKLQDNEKTHWQQKKLRKENKKKASVTGVGLGCEKGEGRNDSDVSGSGSDALIEEEEYQKGKSRDKWSERQTIKVIEKLLCEAF